MCKLPTFWPWFPLEESIDLEAATAEKKPADVGMPAGCCERLDHQTVRIERWLLAETLIQRPESVEDFAVLDFQ